ncbi:MAG: OsmC family protein [Coriobacteriia bacterium]|nr:OsmC family protein [Coriobacteriia bacterium]
MDTVTVKWNDKRRFVAWDEDGHSVVMDATAAYKGDGSGVRPLQLVLYAMAGCTGMDVISILEKKRQVVTGFDLVVKGTQRTDEYPKIYEHIEIEYLVTGIGVTDAAVARAIQLSEEKYCSVQGMLGPRVTVTTTFRVLEAER